jgi:hypothetical protein
MAIPSSGTLALSAIQTEFGGSNPISMSEYYAGGSNVPSGATGDSGSIPSSGAVAVSQFYGSTARVAIALTISSTTQNYNIFANRGGTYSAGISDVTLTVQAIVGSTGASGLDTGNQWTSGDTVKIINNSQIVGRGGAGGAGGGQNAAGSAGAAAQNAINLGFATTIQNNGGFIRGGGGGGGGGNGWWWLVVGWGGADACRWMRCAAGGHTFASASFSLRCFSAFVWYWLPYLLQCSSCTLFGLNKATAFTLARLPGAIGSSPRARLALRCARARRSFARLLACGGTVTTRSA